MKIKIMYFPIDPGALFTKDSEMNELLESESIKILYKSKDSTTDEKTNVFKQELSNIKSNTENEELNNEPKPKI